MDSAARWFTPDYLRSQWVSIMDQLTAWSDRIYWEGYEPLAKACMIIAGVAALILCVIVYTDDKDAEAWSTLAIAGRWMGGFAAVIVVLAAWVGGHGAL